MDKAQQIAAELMKSGKVDSATVQDGKVMVKNQVSGNWEPYHGQQMQDPAGNYAGKKGNS
jgi:hypothetical protein